jgi:lactate dehydrogenase-like 2-hydroxyacid dehydrogenase
VASLDKKFKVVVTSQIHESGIKPLEQEAEIAFPAKPLNLLTARDLIELGKDADAFIAVTNVEKITKEVIEGLPKLRVIARHGVGYDNVDVKAASEKGIYVTTAPVLDETVADQAFALLLCLARNTCKMHNYIVSKEWKAREPFRFMGTDVWGKTAGIIGLGRIGSKIAERAKGFKMRILYYDVVRKTDLETRLGLERKPLDELLKESDIIFISAPLIDATRGMIGEKELELMKPSALLINVARGPIVENLENVVLTPHMASNTIECRRRQALTVAEEVLRVLHGEKPRYALNPEIGQ